MLDTADLSQALTAALVRRVPLMESLRSQDTDGYRLLHGAQEGAPGVTVDRYGDLALLQTFHAPLDEAAVGLVADCIEAALPGLDFVYNDRSEAGSRVRNRLSPDDQVAAEKDHTTTEHGVRFRVRARHPGHDPWLFLDLRPTRKAVMDEAEGKTLLNLFAYTCGVGVSAAVAGAARVLNVDFTRRYLDVGWTNAERNGVAEKCGILVSDVFPALRQIAGIRQSPVARGKKLPTFPHVDRETFDLVFLDPPPWARSPFGVVDLRRDYQSLLKPALGAVADGGILYCTNNSAQVDEGDWHEVLRRCAQKHGRPIRALDVLRPGEDFPSLDGRPPLKVARLEL